MDLFLRHGQAQAPNAVDAKGRPVWDHVLPCSRCGGSGYLHAYKHIQDGICFKCGGSRVGPRIAERLYSAEELAKLNATAAKKAARKAEKAAKAAAEKLAAEEAARIARAAQVAADPFYQRLRSYPGGFLHDLAEKMAVADLSERQIAAAEEAMAREDAKAAARKASAWVGELGERIKFAGVLEKSILIRERDPQIWNDQDRWLVAIKLESGAMLKWFGAYPPAKDGEAVAGSGKVVKHGEYQGVKETLIKNPRWK